MTDTERLDAISKYGLAIMCNHNLIDGEWEEEWHCHCFKTGKTIVGDTIREVIDTSVALCEKQDQKLDS